MNIKIALRSIRKNSLHSVICILGLGIGLGSIMLLSVLYLHDTSSNKFIPEYNNVYRVISGEFCQQAYPLAEKMKEDNPAVSDFLRFYQKENVDIKDSQNNIREEEHFAFADANIFNFWGVKMIEGKSSDNTTEVAISEEIKKKYFGKETAVGKVLNIRINDDFLSLNVCGVYQDFPSNSTLCPKFVAYIDLVSADAGSFKKLVGAYASDVFDFKNWDRFKFETYIRLEPNADPVLFTQFLQQYITRTNNIRRQNTDYALQSVDNIYLDSESIEDISFSRTGNKKDLNYYLAIAGVILLIAVINYILLSNAKINSRLKELGSQKALGAPAIFLIRQIVTESNVVSVLSLVPAIIILIVGIPFVNQVLDQTMDITVFYPIKTWLLLIGIVLFTGTISGLLISLNVLKVPLVLLLKGKNSVKPLRNQRSNAILSFHFVVFIVLITGVFTINKQVNFALNNFIGINPQNIIVYELNTDVLGKQYKVIKNEVDKIPGVIQTAGSSFVPPFNNYLPLQLQNPNGDVDRFDGLIMGQGMLELLGIPVVDGEDFGEYKRKDVKVIFNESAAKTFGKKAGDVFDGFKVCGVVKDFTAHSLHKLIQPMAIIQQNPDMLSKLVVKADGRDNVAVCNAIDKVFKQIDPDALLDSYLLTDRVALFYKPEKSQAKLVNAFALLAIILSVMGLLGMVYNVCLHKTKEIGVRKVNGASISEILFLLNRNFVKWVLLACVIGVPIAYYSMNIWMESFAYKTELSWWIFALSALLAFFIAVLTVSWRSWSTATKNPVDALRYE